MAANRFKFYVLPNIYSSKEEALAQGMREEDLKEITVNLGLKPISKDFEDCCKEVLKVIYKYGYGPEDVFEECLDSEEYKMCPSDHCEI